MVNFFQETFDHETIVIILLDKLSFTTVSDGDNSTTVLFNLVMSLTCIGIGKTQITLPCIGIGKISVLFTDIVMPLFVSVSVLIILVFVW